MSDVLPFAEFGRGRPLVVLLGLTPVAGLVGERSARALLPGLGALARTRRVRVFNRRRGLPARISMRALAREHAEVLRAVGDAPVDVLGFSTGGSIAQQLAADHPEVIRRLVLVGSGCRLDGRVKAAQSAIGRHLRDGRRDLAAGAALSAMGTRGIGVPGIRHVAALIIPTDRDAGDIAATVEAEDGFDLAACPPITVPTLIVAGSRDRFYSHALLEETRAMIEGARLLVVPRRGHSSVLTSRSAVRDIVNFLDR